MDEIKLEKQMHNDEAIKELKTSLAAAKKEQEDRMEKASEHFSNQLSVAADKYLTVNGYMQSRETIKLAMDDQSDMTGKEIRVASMKLAEELNLFIQALYGKFEDTTIEEYETFLDGHFEEDFIHIEYSDPVYATAFELLICQVLQNIGSNLDDMIEFYKSTTAEIKKIEDEINDREAKLLEANG